MSYDPADTSTLEEHSAILANVGRFDEASKALESLEEAEKKLNPSQPSTPWVMAVKAYILMHQEKYQEALVLLEQAIKAEPEGLWYREMRAVCNNQLGNINISLEDYSAIIAYRENPAYEHPDNQISFGWALYKLGQVEEAREIFDGLTTDRILAGTAYRNLGCCNLMLSARLEGMDKVNRLREAQRNLDLGIELFCNLREVDDFLKLDLKDIERSSKSWTEDAEQRDTLRLIRERVGERRRQLEQPLSAEDELSKAIEKFKDGQDTHSVVWLAAQAGFARMRYEAGKWNEAGELDQLLLQQQDRFPEARLGLENCIGELLAEGVNFLKELNWAESARLLQQALGFERQLERPAKLAELQQLVGDTLLKAGQPEQALKHFNEVCSLLQNSAVGSATAKIPALTPSIPLAGKSLKWLLRQSSNPFEQGNLKTADEVKAEERMKQADVQSRQGYAMFGLGEVAQARAHFVEALRNYRLSGSEAEPGSLLGEVCSSLLTDAQSFWTLDDEWQAFAATAQDEELQRDLTTARAALTLYLDTLRRLDRKVLLASLRLATTTPIILEIRRELIPEDTSPTGKLISNYIPDMRSRVLSEMGVYLPTINVRGNYDLEPANYYFFILDEIPLLMGTVNTQMRYCPEPIAKLQELGVDRESVTEAAHPLTGQPGCWVPENYWETLAAQKIELWDDPLIFVIYHLEAFLRQHLAEFMGLEQTNALLYTWGRNESEAALIKSALPDTTSKLRFARVLRALLEEQVPITGSKEILEAILENGLPHDDVSEAVRAVRLRLKPLLLGEHPEKLKSVKLPDDIESRFQQYLKREDGKTFLTMPLEVAQEIIPVLAELVSGADSNAVLLTRSSEIRLFVSRVIHLFASGLKVLAQEEQYELPPTREIRQMEGARDDLRQSS